MTSASPTAASAAATVMTKKTKIWPSIPTERENATNARFTAFSISSTHMKRMIALRRNTTPATPIPNRIAESASDSVVTSRARTVSISDPPLGQQHGADNGDEQQNADELERNQIVTEQRVRDGAHRIELLDGRGNVLRAAAVDYGTGRAEAAPHDPADHTRCDKPDDRPQAATKVITVIMTEVEQHDDEEEQHHDRARIDDDLDRRNEVRAEQHVDCREAEEREHQEQQARDRVVAHDHAHAAADGDRGEHQEEQLGDRRVDHWPSGSSGSHNAVTGWSCAISRSRS